MTNAARIGRGRSLRLPQPPRTAAPRRGWTRRGFLSLSGRAAVAASLAAQARLLSACSDAGHPSDAAWRELASRLSGTVLRPGDPGYAQAAAAQNLRYASILPEGIARCATVEDVATSILWARENDLPLVARCGGHSYAGYSRTTGLQIDLGTMTGATVDPSSAIARVQAGAHNADLSAALEPDFIVSQGRCPPVGVSGLTLGGGFGFSSRKLGLTCDALLETTLVTASGEILTCSERDNPDLFWACRGGGGGNFGINVEYVFELDPASDVSVFELEWSGPDAAAAVFDALQNVLATGPDELSARLAIRTSAGGGQNEPLRVDALGQYFGPSSELRELLAPVYAAATPAREVIADLTFYEAKDFLATNPPPNAFEERSCYTAGPLAGGGIATIVEQLQRWPSATGVGYVAAFGWGGAINRVPADATAVFHRNTLLLLALGADWEDDDPQDTVDADLAWLAELFDDVQPYVLPQSYQNFSDPSLEDWPTAYYGANLDRLIDVKTQIDPDDVFRFPQSIPVDRTRTARAAA